MLNEFLEFEEYTCIINSNTPKRLKWGNLVKDFSGVRRALTIIARHAYYEEKMSIDVINHLFNLWCGFENVSIKEIDNAKIFQNVNGWLPNYILSLRKNVDDEEKIDNLLKKLESKKDIWNRSVYQNSGKFNDKNSIYFEGIIADAINDGPLQKRYLVLREDPLKGTDMKPQVLKDRALKLIAAFLICNNCDSRYSKIAFPTYSNWVKDGCSEGKRIHRVIEQITYTMKTAVFKEADKNVIFHIFYLCDDGKMLSEPVIQLDENWINKYHPQIITEEDVKYYIYNDSYYLYEDLGCTASLKRIK